MTRWLPLLKWATIVVLVAALAAQAKVQEDIAFARSYFAGIVERQVKGEAWLGERVPPTFPKGEAASEGLVLYWLLDLDRCVDCTYDLAHWRELAGSGAIPTVVLLQAADTLEASLLGQDLAEDLLRVSHVSWVSDGFIEDQLGFPFRSFRFVADAERSIVSVDTRAPNFQCTWSYPALVNSMIGAGLSIPFSLAP